MEMMLDEVAVAYFTDMLYADDIRPRIPLRQPA